MHLWETFSLTLDKISRVKVKFRPSHVKKSRRLHAACATRCQAMHTKKSEKINRHLSVRLKRISMFGRRRLRGGMSTNSAHTAIDNIIYRSHSREE